MFYGNPNLSALDSPAYEYGPRVSLLDPLRQFQWAGYRWVGAAFPRSSALPLAAYAQYEDKVQVPPGSWLLGISGSSANQAGFRFAVYDSGAGDFAIAEGFEASQTGAQDNSDPDSVVGHILAEPYCVVSPGVLQIRIVNSANAPNDLSLLLRFAVPIPDLKGGER